MRKEHTPERFLLCLTRDQLKQLKIIAKQQRCSIGQIIRDQIDKLLLNFPKSSQ